MDSSKENAQYDAARKVVSPTNLYASRGINQSHLLLLGFRVADTTASATLGYAEASTENCPQRGRRCHSLPLLLLSD